jgi:iron transport multicopper oxidase
VIVQTSKEGYVYLLDAQNLGGVSPGDAGALAEQGPDGGAWATPGVWPGNGGYIYVPTSNGGTMSLGNSTQGDFNVFQVTKPSGTSSTFDLELVAKGPQPVGFGTSSPIVTSNGITAGSAVVWIIQLQNGGVGEAELQAYDALPSADTSTNPGRLQLINQWPIGNGMKFTPPGVGDNRLFVPTMDNRLMVFGLHAPAIATGRGVTFGSTTVGRTSTATIPIVAKRAFTITSGASACGVCTRTSQFKVVGTEPAFTHGELSVRAGQTLSVTATFRPTGSPGLRSDVLRLVTSHGEVDFTLSGVGRASTPWVTPSTLGLTLPDFIIGQARPVVSTMTFTNFGSVAAKITKYSSNLAPFTVSGVPKVGTFIAPGESFRVKISFSSKTQGNFHRVLIVKTNSPASVANSAIDLNSVASAGP